MSHRDTSIAIKQAIIRALDVTQCHKPAIKEAISQAQNVDEKSETKRSFLKTIVFPKSSFFKNGCF